MKWVRLCRERPGWAHRSCKDCEKYVLDMKTGEIKYDRHGNPEERGIPADCKPCVKFRALGRKEPTMWARTMRKLYITARMLGTLPAPGTILDQERNVARAFMELSEIDYEEKQFVQDMMLARATQGEL